MKLIVGLGNPGPDYDNHKHNLGFWVVDLLAKQHQVRFEKSPTKKFCEARLSLEGEDCWLIKPLTWMNNSGQAVQSVLGEKASLPADLIVIHDDLDLKLGKMKWDFDAGHGGHNGVRSVIDLIQTKSFYRVRLGVGRPPAHIEPADYVLEPFVGDDLEMAEQLTMNAAKSIGDFLKHGLQWVQSRYH